MLEDVIRRLEALGFKVEEADKWVLQFCCDKVENHIKNNCNLDAVPEGLQQVAVDLACGEYLSGRFNAGQLDYEQAVQRLQLGDTDVTYATGNTPADLIKALINDLQSRELDFAAYRRLTW